MFIWQPRGCHLAIMWHLVGVRGGESDRQLRRAHGFLAVMFSPGQTVDTAVLPSARVNIVTGNMVIS